MCILFYLRNISFCVLVEVEVKLSSLKEGNDDLQAILDDIKKHCQSLQQEITDAAYYLPKYSLKSALSVSDVIYALYLQSKCLFVSSCACILVLFISCILLDLISLLFSAIAINHNITQLVYRLYIRTVCPLITHR